MRRGGGDHWSFMFGEIAIYSLVIVTLTGVFLMVFFDPSMSQVVYEGTYRPLRGVSMSRAYASTLGISFDVRGGLLMRQIHHWAALLFVAAVCLQLLRMFFTGAFRRPRGLQWLIWVALLALGIGAGVTGGVLPDDMLSGGTLNLIQSVVRSIPIIGTNLAYLLFGGSFPGEDIIPRMYWAHVLLIPVLMAGLLLLRARLVRRHGHTYFPDPDATIRPRRTAPMLVAVTAVTTLLGTLAQINPVWLYGPFKPGDISAGSVPDWYLGFLDGALRIMPGWEIDLFGQTLTLAVLVPALVVPGAFFTFLALYPALERWITRDRRLHNALDRPRDAATRTALGVAGVTAYGLLWLAAANDQIAVWFHMDVFTVTIFFRFAVFIGPVVAFIVTQRICLGLQIRDRAEPETGRLVRSPSGGYAELPAESAARPLDKASA